MRNLYILITLVIMSNKLLAQTFTNYTKSNSLLCSDSVTSIAFDAHGNRWFGTFNGVSKFDGINWKTYTKTDGLADNHVTCMTIDSFGNKWFGTDKGISKFTDTSWTTYYKPAYYTSIKIDTKNNVWVTSSPIASWTPPLSGIVLSKFDGVNWDSIGYYDETLYSVVIDSMNNVWASSFGLVFKYDNVSFTSYRCGMAAENNSIAIDKNGSIWTSDAYRFDGEKFVQVLKNGMIGNFFFRGRSMAIDSKNNKWFGTDTSGVWKYNDTTWINYTIKDGLINNLVSCIAIDAEGNKWFGTYGGISKMGYDEITALDKISTSNIKLYPIPVKDKLTVSISEFLNQAIVEVFNIEGTKLCYLHMNKDEIELDMSKYPSGVYIVRINMLNKGIIVRQIVKASH